MACKGFILGTKLLECLYVTADGVVNGMQDPLMVGPSDPSQRTPEEAARGTTHTFFPPLI